MQQFLRGWLVFELTGSFAALGLMSLLNGLTGLLLALVGGVVADLVRQRKHVVQLGQAMSGINALVLALLVFSDLLRVEHVLIAAAVHGGSNNLTMPSRQALTPDVVGPERLMNAMGLYSTSQNAARLLMPGIAGGMVGAFSDPGTIGGAAYVYVLIFTHLHGLRRHHVPGARAGPHAASALVCLAARRIWPMASALWPGTGRSRCC